MVLPIHSRVHLSTDNVLSHYINGKTPGRVGEDVQQDNHLFPKSPNRVPDKIGNVHISSFAANWVSLSQDRKTIDAPLGLRP